MSGTMSERVYIEHCVNKYSKSMMRAAYSILGNLTEAEDAVQDTFIKLCDQKPTFNDENHEKAWLLRVVINQAKNRVRKIRRLTSFEESISGIEFASDDRRTVYEAVRSLEEKYRIVIHLHFFEGYKIKEIASLLSLPQSTVGTHLERAKAQLKKILEKEGI